MDIVHPLLDGFLAGGMERPAAWHVEKRSPRAMRVVLEIEDPFVRARRLEQHSSRAIAEQHTRRAILVIQNGSHRIASDYQRFLVRARADELRADGQRVGKAGARCGKVKAPRLLRANALLH